ncbi:MAG: B12-binding domain-containing radical SAM protein [Desulfohalobiaceae bacterium]|nr:B12-binding domain-containing radical SAM protein [Desulfohalobiaceae bacterium]
MDVLLIHPPFLEGYSKARIDLPPLGIGYLASVLRGEGHTVRIADLNIDSRYLLDRVGEFDLVGISGDTPRHGVAMELAAKVREQGVPVAMGGPHVSFRAEENLRSGPVDYVVRGEGEESFRNLVRDLQEGGDGVGVPGISCRNKGEVLHNPTTSFLDINDIPLPSRDLLPMSSYRVYVGNRLGTTVIASRGCPFNCSFCSSSELFGLRWRPREPEAIVDEVEYLYRHYGFRAVLFMDDNFTLDPDRTIRICELMLKRGLDVKWWCFSRVTSVNQREDMVESMAEAGGEMVFLGVETPHEEVLDHYGKKATSEDAQGAVRILRKHGIRIYGSLILGDPQEDQRMIRQTISYAKSLNPNIAQFAILTPYPGTRLYDEMRPRLLDRDWSYYDGLHSVISYDYLTPEEVEGFLKKAYLTFYLQPKKLLVHGRNMAKFLLYLAKR